MRKQPLDRNITQPQLSQALPRFQAEASISTASSNSHFVGPASWCRRLSLVISGSPASSSFAERAMLGITIMMALATSWRGRKFARCWGLRRHLQVACGPQGLPKLGARLLMPRQSHNTNSDSFCGGVQMMSKKNQHVESRISEEWASQKDFLSLFIVLQAIGK